jgi:hypothetical protein
VDVSSVAGYNIRTVVEEPRKIMIDTVEVASHVTSICRTNADIPSYRSKSKGKDIPVTGRGGP